MSHLEITVRVVDDEGNPVSESPPLRISQQVVDLAEVRPGEVLDHLEAEVVASGFALLRQILRWRLEQLDASLAAQRTHQEET